VRRKLAGLVLLLGALWVGAYLMGAAEKVVPVEIHYVLGDPPVAPRLEAVFRQEGSTEPIARFATEMVSRDVVHRTRLPKGRHVVEITLGDGPTVTRTIDAQRDAVIRLELSREGR
jgi:hypothetical protein